ncbi:MAG: hypothetical protein H6538_06620 [Bacteroidales bacterium]|nr:hypothetical protein [Bacteroidales bacterium]MCB9000207.1 hypothetical protein [Bacteroidales bacterium]MCB9013714.1 hypothetical protein [Bacteroidales bacterium]
MPGLHRYFVFLLIISLVQSLQGSEPKDSTFLISEILITGNKVSRESIILKELTFQQGSVLSSAELDEAIKRSRENLLNTSLYNFVNIYHSEDDNNQSRVIISVVERWYIWPSPIFEHAERNLGAFINNPDWNRINYGGQIFWDNFRGRREQVKLKYRLGYKQQLEIYYGKPNIGRDQKNGISFVLNQTRQHEVNEYSENNKPVYLKNENSFLAELFNPYFIYSYRSTLYARHTLNLGYLSFTYRDSASHENFTGLPYESDPRWLFFDYSFEYDIRDLKAYPLNGDYIRLNLSRREFLTEGVKNYSASSLQITASHHRKIIDRLYYNDAVRIYFSRDQNLPKLYRTGIGYGPYLRGYELFVIDGNSYGLMVNNLKYCIMREKTYKLALIPWSQFNPAHFSVYGNLFFDMAYAHGKYYGDRGNTYANRYLYTAGLGLDLVSYYDLVVRLEASINREGQTGFFIHTEVPFRRW